MSLSGCIFIIRTASSRYFAIQGEKGIHLRGWMNNYWSSIGDLSGLSIIQSAPFRPDLKYSFYWLSLFGSKNKLERLVLSKVKSLEISIWHIAWLYLPTWKRSWQEHIPEEHWRQRRHTPRTTRRWLSCRPPGAVSFGCWPGGRTGIVTADIWWWKAIFLQNMFFLSLITIEWCDCWCLGWKAN